MPGAWVLALPGGAAPGVVAGEPGPCLDGDKKAMTCFPSLEKVMVPSSVVLKAGVSIMKRLTKLSSAKQDLGECEAVEVVQQTLGLL